MSDTPRPDPVTEARDALERLLPDVLRYDPVSMPAFDQRIDALIEAVRAEAGVSMTLPGSDELARTFHEQYERLAPSFGYVTRRDSSVPWEDVPEPNRSLMVAVATEVLERWSALAALSAGSGSRVEARCAGCEEAEDHPSHRTEYRALDFHRFVPIDEPTRPTPPPAVDGWTFEALTGDGWAILPPPSEDFPEDDPRGDWQASGYGSAIAYRREDAVRIVNALNGTPPPAGATQVPLPATDSTPPPAVDGTRCGFRLGCGGRPDDPQHQRPFSGWGSMTAHDFEPNTPPPAVDGTRCAECGGVKDDVFHVPCLVGGPFHYVKTCHPFTPPTPDPDRLRALEAALRDWVEEVGLHDACDPDEFCSLLGDLRKKEPAARALLAPDGEGSRS